MNVREHYYRSHPECEPEISDTNNPDPWYRCSHIWREVESAGNSERFVDVVCTKCECPGQKDLSTDLVYWHVAPRALQLREGESMNVREHYYRSLEIKLRQDQIDFIESIGRQYDASVYDVIDQYIRDGIAADKKRQKEGA